jgi:hypothetical protein
MAGYVKQLRVGGRRQDARNEILVFVIDWLKRGCAFP